MRNVSSYVAQCWQFSMNRDPHYRYSQRLKLLRQTDRAILTARSSGEIAQIALVNSQELLPFKRASVVLFDEEARLATIIGAIAPEDSPLSVGTQVSAATYGDLEELRHGKLYLVDDIRTLAPNEIGVKLEADGVRSFISVPLIALEHVIGMLNVSSDQVAAFSPEDVEIAQEVANSLAVALHQARLHQEVQRHADLLEHRVAARAAELLNSNRRLQQSQELLRSLYDNTPVMMHSINAESRVIEVNQFWLDALGYQREEVIGRHIAEFVPPEFQEARGEVLDRLRQDGFIKDIEVQVCRKNGEVLDLKASSVLKRDAEGRFLYTQTFLVDITEQRRAQRENSYLQEQIRTELNFEEIVGTSAVMQRVFQAIDMVAPTDSTVLLLGETGTGKELIARALHNRSRRKPSVMVKLNCGALPASLVESELFGHEKGSFTGAIAQRKGRFEIAHRGTLFLDEIGELPLETQSKLLRVLQEQEFERVGGAQTQKVDVRVIAASNRDLEEEVRRGVFRSDLFYRLNVFPIEVPPLRDRKEDIPLLAAYFVGKFTQRMGRRIFSIHRSAQEQLMDYDWPGNVRELANLLERAVILCQGDTLLPQHISVHRGRPVSSASVPEPLPTLEDGERRLILRALEQTGGVLAGPNGAAQLLGINRSTLWSRMRKLGIEAPKRHVTPQ